MSTQTLDALFSTARSELDAASDLAALEAWHVRYFGRERGEIQAMFRQIPALPVAERKSFGSELNRLKQELETHYTARHEAIQRAALEEKLAAERIDVTLPGRRLLGGSLHPLTGTLEHVLATFSKMGFGIAEGPEVESDWFNFTALNTPADHPARDMQDTFYLPDGRLLRTHTSSVQIREMLRQPPPLRLVMPGRVYRRDAVTARHYPIFHQLEGLVVERKASFGQLKWVLSSFAKATFGEDRKVRLRPSFFPFTEPSAELDVECLFCEGGGCRICSRSGWIELGGCGMVDPNVFAAVNERRAALSHTHESGAYDPEEFTGFAFGFGIERIVMLVHGIPDIRLFWENDLRFLRQF